jgi:hypothetical protein
VHGTANASSRAQWQELFAEAGYESSAPGWPGDVGTIEGTRAAPQRRQPRHRRRHQSLRELHRGLPAKPILIGH